MALETIKNNVLPAVDRVLEVRTPFGRPVAWAEIAMVSDIGDSHDLNDDRCLVITSRDLGGDAAAADEFVLCVLADGATGSTFAPDAAAEENALAGWRASQLAQAAFVERYLTSSELDILDRLKDGLRAADRALLESDEGSLSTTLTALVLLADGTAYAASIGDSVLVVLPPGRRTPADRRLKKLGYEDTTAVGSGDTTLTYVDEGELIEQWWPSKEGGPVEMRVKPGTCFVLMSDGIADNLPVEFIDQLVHRHTLDRATIGLPQHTRERRAQTQRRGGGSTSQLGLDNMSAIVVRFDGLRHAQRPVAGLGMDDARLLSVLGTHGGPTTASGGTFGLVCLAEQSEESLIPGFLRDWIESEHQVPAADRLCLAYLKSQPGPRRSRFAALARDESGQSYAFSEGSPELSAVLDVSITERTVAGARDSAWQRFIYRPRLWGSTLAALAVFLLVSTAFATGTVRPAPPPAPTALPGEPTPTPDTRPGLSLGGFLLVPPALQPTPTPPSLSSDLVATPTDVSADGGPAETPPVEPILPSCSNPLGLLCGRAPPPPPANPGPSLRLQPPSQPTSGPIAPDNPVVPVASPAANLAPAGADEGSQLDDALRVASAADQRFERGLTLHAVPQATPRPASP
jgi:serine/threonine protein phosphatase PrpC